MECPRCGDPLTRYVLGGREAVVCESCGYIGVPVEHHGELREIESWDDAIARFEETAHVEAGHVETTEDDPTPEFVTEQREETPEPTVVRIETPTGVEPTAATEDDDEDEDGDGVSCGVCGKEFDSQTQLNGHMAVHAEE